MPWVRIESLMVFLSLENVDQISSLNGDACDVKNLVLSFLLMIWWVWDLKLLLVPLIVHLHKPKLWETVFETDTVKSDAPDLDSDRTLSWSSWIDSLEV